jgi:transglutaminase-like putative cysteine protease
MLQALPVAAVLFILFPRPGGPLWGLPGDASRTRIGLSESMTPGVISELGESREIAFQVEFDGPVPAPATLYWRGPVFGDFDGKTWRALPQTRGPLPPMQLRVDDGQVFAYNVSQEPSGRRWLFVLEMPVRVTMPAPFSARLLPDLQLITDSSLDRRIRFRAESSHAWRAGLNESPASLQNWLDLPAGFNPRTLALAARWLEDEKTSVPAEERGLRLVERALTMFRKQPFRYTLRPPQSARDSVDDFLFEQRAGFCEHFAAAFVVLMRALGIPARVVTGYQGGERNPIDGRWLVRQADAHAWAEVWLPGRGWQRVDPTAAVAPERIEHGVRLEPDFSGADGFDAATPLLARLRLRLDGIANRWSQWLLSYDSARQQRVLERIGLPIGDWRALAAALALSLTLAIGAIAVLTLRPRSARDPVQRSWDEFCKRLARAELERFPHETALAYLRRVEPSLDPDRIAEARRIVSLYNTLRYGGGVKPHGVAPPHGGTEEHVDAESHAGAAQHGYDVRHLRRCVKQFRP